MLEYSENGLESWLQCLSQWQIRQRVIRMDWISGSSVQTIETHDYDWTEYDENLMDS